MSQTLKQLIALIRSDLYRYHGRRSLKDFLGLLLQERGFVASLLYRITRFAYVNQLKWFFWPVNIIYSVFQEVLNFEISYKTSIGAGLRIDHLMGLVINQHCSIGKNINLSHQVTLGMKPEGQYAGAPVLKDNIYIAPGAKVIGGVHILNHTAIGANAVVTKDTCEFAVMGGIPAKVISMAGSVNYCLYTDYEAMLPDLPDSSSC
jgi:serine O-acetyltransferase